VAKQLLERNRAYTLFATHYFELTRIVDEFKYAVNVHLDAVEHGNSIVFMHKVEEGAANQSYGLQVAQLAGIPKSVITAAKRKLAQLELNQVANQDAKSVPQVDMFMHNEQEAEVQLHPALSELESLQVDDLTPRQALDLLYKIKSLI
jgi:DNA mismatch repair protein MutS